MTKHEIEIELRRSLEGTHRYSSMSSGRGVAPRSAAARPDTIASAATKHAGSPSSDGNSCGGSSVGLSISASGGAGTGVLYPALSYEIVGAAIEVHRWLGPGRLESNYQRAMEKELALRGIPFRTQVPISSRYKGADIGEFFVDLIVDDAVVLELKAVSTVLPVHRAQLMSYLRTTGCRLGMLMNFHVPVLVQGIKRIAL